MDVQLIKTTKNPDGKICALERMSLVIECLALNISGEARYELRKLIEDVQNNEAMPQEEKAFILTECEVALSNLLNNDIQAAISQLSSKSRVLLELI